MSNIYNQEPATCGKVILNTTVGDIEIELFSKECSLTCRNFVQLCMDGYYNGAVLHQVVPNSIAEGGASTGTDDGGESPTNAFFPDKFDSRLCYNRRGFVGMINKGPNINGCQFIFSLDPTLELDNRNTLFGKFVGNSLLNMLKLSEGEIIGERPVHKHKIIKTDIISNPFENMEPRPRLKPQIIDNTDEDFGKEEVDRVRQRFNTKKVAKQEKRKSVVLDAGDDDNNNQQDISLPTLNENVKFKIERYKKVLRQSKKPSTRIEASEDTVQEEKESTSHLIQQITTATCIVTDELMAGTRRNNNKTHSNDSNSKESQIINMSSCKFNQSASPLQPETPRYNLRSKKMTDENIDQSIEKSSDVRIKEDIMISVIDLVDLLIALIKYKNIKPRQARSEDIQKQINEIDKIIEQCLLKLPSLTSVEENQLVISNVETNLNERKKQFYYVVLYYIINKHWPFIKTQAPSLLRLVAFFNLLEFLIDMQVLTKFDENCNDHDVFNSYVITSVAYLIVASDPRCSSRSVDDFVVVFSHGFTPVDTSGEAFISFFKLLQSILSTPFVIQLYCELINYEENVSQEMIEQSLIDNVSKLQIHMYLAHLPDYYCALTLYDGKLLLNSSELGLFKRIDKMIRWDWSLDSLDDIMIGEWAALVIVILHEIAHGLRRTIIPKARNLILAQTPPKNIIDSQREAGFHLETLLFGHRVESIGLLDGGFLLNVANWTAANVECFQKKLKEVIKKDEEQSEKTRLKLPCRCVQEPTLGTRLRIGSCATSQYAIHLNK